MFYALLIFLHVAICFLLVGVVLIQSGKGGGLAGLGGGAQQAVFGGRGASDLLSKLTQGLAVAFMVSSLALAFSGGIGGDGETGSVVQQRHGQTIPAAQALQQLELEDLGEGGGGIALPPPPDEASGPGEAAELPPPAEAPAGEAGAEE
jgi:preprotein translocase subunit SecG